MGKLYVVGNCYSDNEKNAQELFNVLISAGYILGYNQMSKNSAVIMKEVADEETSNGAE